MSWLPVLTIRSEHEYMTLNVSTQLERFPLKWRAELVIYEHRRNIKSSHPGQSYIRTLRNAFEIPGPHGRHQCLVQPPMHMSILGMLEMNTEPLNALLLKHILKRLLNALDFLHAEAHLVHTGKLLFYSRAPKYSEERSNIFR